MSIPFSGVTMRAGSSAFSGDLTRKLLNQADLDASEAISSSLNFSESSQAACKIPNRARSTKSQVPGCKQITLNSR